MASEKVEHSNVDMINEPNSHTEQGKSALITDNYLEHEQTVFQVIRGHPVLVWWAFFFSVSAIAW